MTEVTRETVERWAHEPALTEFERTLARSWLAKDDACAILIADRKILHEVARQEAQKALDAESRLAALSKDASACAEMRALLMRLSLVGSTIIVRHGPPKRQPEAVAEWWAEARRILEATENTAGSSPAGLKGNP
jgi:hypothetical protein